MSLQGRVAIVTERHRESDGLLPKPWHRRAPILSSPIWIQAVHTILLRPLKSWAANAKCEGQCGRSQ